MVALLLNGIKGNLVCRLLYIVFRSFNFIQIYRHYYKYSLILINN